MLKESIRCPKDGLNLNSNFCKQNREADFVKSKTEAILILKTQSLPIWKGNGKYRELPKVEKFNYAFKVFINLLVPALSRFFSEKS